jgi:hypothetical protein
MDILKLLATTKFFDADPSSDAEDRPNTTRTTISGAPVAVKASEGKKSKKGKAHLVSNEIADEMSIEGIIEDKPGKKKVIKFLKARIQHYLDSDSD